MQLDEIITQELRPFMADGRRNIAIAGPPVLLDPRGALALGMAIHELATNAVKYGALSVPEGDVAVQWTVERAEDGEQLLLEWVERSGPPVTAPSKRGFGSMLIERALSHDLSGRADIEFLLEGVRALVRARLPDAAQTASVTGDRN